MVISANYVCPINGLVDLDTPEPRRLRLASDVARQIGVERLVLPVLEESLLKTSRTKVRFLDHLIETLEIAAKSGIHVWINFPAQRLLSMDWVPPYLVRGGVDLQADQVFVDGKVRRLRPYSWWRDPSILQKRIALFRELVSAVAGHPTLSGWLIMDRAFEWARPDRHAADLIVRSTVAEIREKDEAQTILMSIGWKELLHPKLVQSLSGHVNGFHLGGLDRLSSHFSRPSGLVGELMVAAYMVSLGRSILSDTIEVETGWAWPVRATDFEEVGQAYRWLAEQAPVGVVFPSLIDPEPALYPYPPWSFKPELTRMGVIDRQLEPKEHVESMIRQFAATRPKKDCFGYIDISKDDYGADPEMHFPRLWNHFRDWVS